MKAPDKLYLTAVQQPNTGLTELQCTTKPLSNEHSILYIRKDALLEWAKEQYEFYKRIDEDFAGTVFIGNRQAFSEMINKLNSL